jgi:hypothetical protein
MGTIAELSSAWGFSVYPVSWERFGTIGQEPRRLEYAIGSIIG